MASALFICTLNEVTGLRALYDQIPVAEFDEVYALDGGSTDGTVAFFEERRIPVTGNICKGEIFNVAALMTQAEYIVWFAPDGNEDPGDILNLLNLIKNDGFDMAIARRFGPSARNEEDDQVFKWRAWFCRLFALLVRMRWGGNLYDPINGFRAVRRSKLFEMDPEPSGFDIEFQLSIRALKLKHRILEIPTREGNRIGGVSKSRSFPTGWLMLRRLIKELSSQLPKQENRRLQTIIDIDGVLKP